MSDTFSLESLRLEYIGHDDWSQDQYWLHLTTKRRVVDVDGALHTVSPVYHEPDAPVTIHGVIMPPPTDPQNPLHGGPTDDHPEHPHDDWVYEVQNGDTRLGYWAWVVSKLEEAADE